VVQLYDALAALTASPVVAINRALAIAELQGASIALEAMQEATADVRLVEYQQPLVQARDGECGPGQARPRRGVSCAPLP